MGVVQYGLCLMTYIMKKTKYLKTKDECHGVEQNLLENESSMYDLAYESDQREIQSCRRCHDPYWCGEWEVLSSVQVACSTKIEYFDNFEITALLPYKENANGERLRFFFCEGIMLYLTPIIKNFWEIKTGKKHDALNFSYTEDSPIPELTDCVLFLDLVCEVSDLLKKAKTLDEFDILFSYDPYFKKIALFTHFFDVFKDRFLSLLDELITILKQAINDGHVSVPIREEPDVDKGIAISDLDG